MLILAKGLNGILYRLAERKHREPRRNLAVPDESLQDHEIDGDLNQVIRSA